MTTATYGLGVYGSGPYGGAHDDLLYTVELDVSGSAFGTTFSATDVSSKAVAGFTFPATTVTWGRQDQHSDVTPTTVDGVLLNSDGTFTPGNTSSTYYPKIKRGLRRRVSVAVNSTTVHLSEDYATSIEVEPSNTGPAVTRLSGSDILARLGQATSTQDVNALSIGTTLRSFLAEEMMLDAPTCLYMMQEADSATSFADVVGAGSPLVVTNSKYPAGTITAGQTPPGTFYGGTVVDITNPNYGTTTKGGSWLAGSLPSTALIASVETWVQMPAAAPASVNATVWSIVAGNGVPILLEIVASTGQLQLSSGGTSVVSPSSVCDGGLHQIVTFTANSFAIYVDGVLVASFPGHVLMTAGAGAVTIGMTNDTVGGTHPFSGAVAFLGVWGTSLSDARVTAHYQAGVTAFAGESTNARITRLLSYRANTGSSLDTGLGTMGVQDIASRSLQDCLFEVAQVEGGVVFADGTGQVNFRSRSRLFNPTPTVTLDMSVGGVDFGSNWREDTQNVVNDATVTNSTTGSAQRFTSSPSITADGEYATNISLPLNSDADALNMAGWIVANGTQQQLTATPLIVNLLHLTRSQAQAVLQLKPFDCLRLTNCPTPTPAATQTFIVEGGTFSLAADAATATLNLTPLPYPVGAWDSTNWDATGVTWAF